MNRLPSEVVVPSLLNTWPRVQIPKKGMQDQLFFSQRGERLKDLGQTKLSRRPKKVLKTENGQIQYKPRFHVPLPSRSAPSNKSMYGVLPPASARLAQGLLRRWRRTVRAQREMA